MSKKPSIQGQGNKKRTSVSCNHPSLKYHTMIVYNQIQITLIYRLFMTFSTNWGIYAHTKMPFGLYNAPAMF